MSSCPELSLPELDSSGFLTDWKLNRCFIQRLTSYDPNLIFTFFKDLLRYFSLSKDGTEEPHENGLKKYTRQTKSLNATTAMRGDHKLVGYEGQPETRRKPLGF